MFWKKASLDITSSFEMNLTHLLCRHHRKSTHPASALKTSPEHLKIWNELNVGEAGDNQRWSEGSFNSTGSWCQLQLWWCFSAQSPDARVCFCQLAALLVQMESWGVGVGDFSGRCSVPVRELVNSSNGLVTAFFLFILLLIQLHFVDHFQSLY